MQHKNLKISLCQWDTFVHRPPADLLGSQRAGNQPRPRPRAAACIFVDGRGASKALSLVCCASASAWRLSSSLVSLDSLPRREGRQRPGLSPGQAASWAGTRAGKRRCVHSDKKSASIGDFWR